MNVEQQKSKFLILNGNKIVNDSHVYEYKHSNREMRIMKDQLENDHER